MDFNPVNINILKSLSGARNSGKINIILEINVS
jgi:hypothetical protein